MSGSALPVKGLPLHGAPVRMKDIARDLHVSVVTVSKVLRGSNDIGEATRKRVLKRIKELNYKPNWVARSLTTRCTYLIAMVVPDLMHTFFVEIARAVSQRVRPAGYDVVICDSEEDAALEAKELEHLLARQVDGLILASAQGPRNPASFEMIEARDVPYILVDRRFSDLNASYVGMDDEQAGYLATEHLIRAGCRQIAHISVPAIATGAGRLVGYRKALARYGVPFSSRLLISGNTRDQDGYEGARALLRLKERPDGLFCYNDPVATGALKAIFEAGLRVPGDIKVIGAGNFHYSDRLRVPLSTVDQKSARIGELAADLLLKAMSARRRLKPKSILIPPRLVIRESSGGARKRRVNGRDP